MIRICVVGHFAVKQADDAGAVLLGKVGVVRDHDDEFVLRDLFEDLHDLHAGHGVKRARRFVGKQDIGIVDQRPRDGHALHLPARHLVGLFADLIAQPHLLQGGDGAGAALLAGNARKRQRQFDVGEHRLVRDEVVTLKHETHRMVAVGVPVGVFVFFGRAAVDHKVAAVVAVKPADHVEERGLAAAGGAEHGHELALAEIDAHAAQRGHGGVARGIGLDDITQ